MAVGFGTYSVSIDVSSIYFIGADNRLKYYQSGIDLVSNLDSEVEPVGIACVECVETGSFLINAFRVKSGLDLSKLIMIAKSPGVMDLPPSRLIFSKQSMRSLSILAKNGIKKDANVDSIAFSSIESDLAKSLPGYSFGSVRNFPVDINDLEKFISYVNEKEYELSIRRKLLKSVRRDVISEIKDLSMVNAVRLYHPRSDWRPAPDAQKPLDSEVCAITDRVGIIDICSVVDRPANPFGRNGFDPFGSSHDWMQDDDDEDDDGDGDDVYYDECGNRLNLRYENHIWLILVFHMLVCDNELWDDIDVDDIYQIEEFEEDLPLNVYESLVSVINGNCIFKDIDSGNFLWSVNELSEIVDEYCFVELVVSRHSKSRNKFFVTIFDGGAHISIMRQQYYCANDIDDNLDAYGISSYKVIVKASVINSIQRVVDLVKSPESMFAAVALIKEMLIVSSEDFKDLVSDF